MHSGRRAPLFLPNFVRPVGRNSLTSRLSRDKFQPADVQRNGQVRHPVDIAVMFTALWVLASMILDLLTPVELTIYMIAAAIAPAVLVASLLYYFRFPLVDFAVMFAALWLLAAMTIEWISPKQLSSLMIVGAFVPALIVGVWLRIRPRFRTATADKPEGVEVSSP